MSWTRQQMAARAARELNDGEYVNLRVGLPTLIPDHLPAGSTVTMHAEDGKPVPLRRRGRLGPDQCREADRHCASRRSFVDSPTSFAMIRGGHIDTAVLGTMQESVTSDLANWMVPGAS